MSGRRDSKPAGAGRAPKRARSAAPGRAHPVRWTVLTALITAFAVAGGGVGGWFALGGVAEARAGTLDALAPVGDAGAWVAAPADPLVSGLQLGPNAVAEVTGFDAVPAVSGETPTSWVVQITARGAAAAGGIWIAGTPADAADDPAANPSDDSDQPGAGEASATGSVQPTALRVPAAAPGAAERLGGPVLVFGAEGETSASCLVALPEDGVLRLVGDVSVSVDVQTVAYFTNAGGDNRPAPSGTAAVAPRLVLDSAAGIGANGVPGAATPAWISPGGLGGVPSSGGVAGAWLQVSALGEGSVEIGGRDARAQALVVEGAGSALTPAQLDADGRVWIAASGGVTELTVSLVGWTAGADGASDASGFPDGIAFFPPVAGAAGAYPALPATAPAGATPLCVGTSAGAGTAAGPTGTAIALAADASWLLDGGEATELTGATEKNVVCVAALNREGSGGPAPEIAIDTPGDGTTVALGENGAAVTFSGSARSADGIKAVTLKRGNRFLGTAEVRAGAEGFAWSYTTSVARGKQTITAEATSWSGAVASESVTATFTPPAADAAVVSAETVVVGQDVESHLISAAERELRFDTAIDLRLGDVLVFAPSALLPEGKLAKVTAIEQVGGEFVAHTAPGTLLDVFQQVDHTTLRAPLAAGETELAETSTRVGEPGVALVAAGAGAGGAAQPAVAGAGGAAQPAVVQAAVAEPAVVQPAAAGALLPQAKEQLTVANVELRGRFDARVGYANGQRTVSASLNTTAKSDGKTLIDEKYDLPVQNVQAGMGLEADQDASKVEADANLTAQLALKLKTTIDFILDIRFEWGFFSQRVTGSFVTFELCLNQNIDEEFSLNATGEFSYGMNSEVAQSSAAAKTKALREAAEETARWLLGRANFVIVAFGMPVPVSLSFYATASINLGVYASGEFSVNQSFSTLHRLGFRLADGKFSKIDESRNTKKPTTAKLKVTADAALVPSIGLEGYIWDAIGVTGDLSLLLELSAEVEASANTAGVDPSDGSTAAAGARACASARLEAYLFASLGARVVIFGAELFDWDSDEFELGYWLLWEYFGSTSADGGCEVDDATVAETQPDESAVGRGNRPLVLVMDISGSMAGDRITEAKSAMTGIVKEQPVGAEIGLYTYPGGDQGSDGCYAGQFIIPVAPITGVGSLLDAIDHIQTTGDTPTGSALAAVVDRLDEEGHTGATILLVSDGESNCGPPPCEEAAQIAARGFEITVPTVAFDISDSGRAELACISQATGALTYEVSGADQGELWDLIEDLSMATIAPTVNVASATATDSVLTVEITLTNPSARDVAAAQFTVRATGAGVATRVTPAANIAVGNIPPGASVTRAVEVTVTGGAGSVELDVIAWGSNVSGVEVADSFRVVPEEDIDYEPGELVDKSSKPSVTLGDGFAGTADDADRSGGSSGTAGDGIVYQDSVLGLAQAAGADQGADGGVSRAQVGATTRNLLDTPLDGQPPQLTDLPADPGNAILTIGAEDVGLSHLLRQCAAEDCAPDSAAFANAIRAAQEIDWAGIYRSVAGALGVAAGRSTPLLVPAYPYLFPEDRGRSCSAEYSAGEAQAFNSLVAHLNSAIEAGVAAAAKDGFEVYFVRDTAYALRSGPTLCADVPGLALTEVGAALSDAGARALGKGLALWSQRAERIKPSGAVPVVVQPTAAPSGLVHNLFNPTIKVTVDSQPVASWEDVDVTDRTEGLPVVKIGQRLAVQGAGYQPDSLVNAMLYFEEAVFLGIFTTDEEGRLDAVLTIPFGVPAGEQYLTLTAVTADGNPERIIQAIGVEAPLSPAVEWSALGGTAAFGLAILFWVVSLI
ncbi:MAG: VWA domain-containing protein, partial [Bifidobacteriaceae bacterium]|nr:VWA domain-containing protein [Bifidobacteriaceae bacterium]